MTVFLVMTIAAIGLYFWKVKGRAPRGATSDNKAPLRMSMEMIQSNGQPITSAQALKLFKQFMLKSGRLEKDELAEHAEYFSDALKAHAEYLSEEFERQTADAKETAADFQEDISRLKREIKAAKEEIVRTELQDDLEGVTNELKEHLHYVNAAKEELAAFKADKRQFLVDYVNHQA